VLESPLWIEGLLLLGLSRVKREGVVSKEKLNMENALNTTDVDSTPVRAVKKRNKPTKNAIGGSKIINSNNVMARRYELAYMKLHNELPEWKKQSFNKNNKNANDALYNEFIDSVIALAENSNDPILLTA